MAEERVRRRARGGRNGTNEALASSNWEGFIPSRRASWLRLPPWGGRPLLTPNGAGFTHPAQPSFKSWSTKTEKPDTTQYNQAIPSVEAVPLDALAGFVADRQPHARREHG